MATTPGNQSNLKRLIREAGYTYQTVDRRRVELLFAGPYRPWTVATSLTEQWFWASTYVCAIPEPPGRKAELSDLLLRLNQENAIVKYAYHDDTVYLQAQYRAEHTDAEAMRGLVGALIACANDDYPRIVRVLTGDETLKRLERQFNDTTA
jgi:hypothetical protein